MSYYIQGVCTLQTQSTHDCWYACYKMLVMYQDYGRRVGRCPTKLKPLMPMGLVLIYKRRKGLTNDDFPTFMKKGEMKIVPPPKTDSWSAKALAQRLTKYGPIWCAGNFGPKHEDHAVLLTGVSGGLMSSTVYYNDPYYGAERKNSLAWFNKYLGWKKYFGCCMLYRDA